MYAYIFKRVSIQSPACCSSLLSGVIPQIAEKNITTSNNHIPITFKKIEYGNSP